MRTVSLTELRKTVARIIDRVLAGESMLVTRSGKAVAELRPIRRAGLPAKMVLARWRNLPSVDPIRFRADLDSLLR